MNETERKIKEIADRWLDCSFLERFNLIGRQYIKQLEGLKILRNTDARRSR